MDGETGDETGDPFPGQASRKPPARHQTDITDPVKQDYEGASAVGTGLVVLTAHRLAWVVVRLRCRREVDLIPQPPGRLLPETEAEIGVTGRVLVGVHASKYSLLRHPLPEPTPGMAGAQLPWQPEPKAMPWQAGQQELGFSTSGWPSVGGEGHRGGS